MINYEKYIDNLGRWHTKPVTEAKPYPTNNAYIYSFYAKIVDLPVVITNPAASQLMNLDTEVLTRHPGDREPPISHDEYVGAAGLDLIYATDIVEFGEKNYFQYCDIPGFIPIPFRKLVIHDVIEAYEGLANDPETNVRKAVVKYPALYPFAFWHRPNVQYFYYRCAGRSPGTYRTIFHFIASLVSFAQNDPTSVMSGFQFLKYKKLGFTFTEKILYYIYKKRIDFKQNCKNYFPEDHPILNKINNL